jgi:PAS domain S-box-containing protein
MPVSTLFFISAMKDHGQSRVGEPAGAPGLCPANSPHRILVVDDDRDARRLTLEVLIGAGYHVEAVKDGAAGWEALQANGYDLVITDNKMPKMTGIEMIEKLRSASRAVPVIMATASVPTHEFARKPWLKPYATLPRPFSNDDLLEAVRRVLRTDDGSDGRNEARMERTLGASEISYRRLFEAAKDGILILDADTGRINDVNPFLIKLLGFSHSEMIGKTVGELSPFKDVVSNQAMLERLQQYGYVRYEDLPLETRDGRHIAVEFVSNVYQAGDKKVIQCNIRDITERKRTEDQLKASFKEIGDLKSAVDEHAIVAITDPQGIIIYVNDKFCAISKYSREELLGQDHRIINSGYHPKDFIRELWATITRGKVWKGELKNKAKDGSYYWVDTTIVPFLNDQGQPRQYVAIRTDITGRKAVEERIHQLNVELEHRVFERTAQLQAANQELEAFSYSVSHDLRAPLRHVMGFVELLRQDAGTKLSKNSLQHLTTISQAAQRMGQLIDELLAFSRIGQSEMQRRAVNLDELVREALRDFQAEMKERNIAWNIHPLPAVRADRALLRLVLVNLISNAIKFTGTRAEAKIEIGSAPSGDGETVIFIHDNGAGFDPRYAGKLFGVFQRLHSRDEFEGTGIGLANVRRIIHRHGGRTWAEGVVDGGATFYFSIPKQNGGINGH